MTRALTANVFCIGKSAENSVLSIRKPSGGTCGKAWPKLEGNCTEDTYSIKMAANLWGRQAAYQNIAKKYLHRYYKRRNGECQMSNEELIIGLSKKLIEQDSLIEYYRNRCDTLETQLRLKENITESNDDLPLDGHAEATK